MVIVVGEILIDIFKTYERIGGAPFNFAFHLKKLGVPVRFFSRIGNDNNGRKIRAFIEDHGFDGKDLQIDTEHPTGTVTVALDNFGVPTFTIHRSRAYDFLNFDPMLQIISETDVSLVYFGTLIQRTPPAMDRLRPFLSTCLNRARRYCDINLRPGCYSQESVRQSLAQADILKLNDEELQLIGNLLNAEEQGPGMVRHLMTTYTLDMVLLTKGKRGSELFTPRSHDTFDVAPSERIMDTVGAGDAFAAMSAYGILQDWSYPKLLAKASELAARICGIRGAIPEHNDVYENLLTP